MIKPNKKISMKKDTNLISNIQSLTSNNHRGITLIALIITILVMLILVGVSITIAVNGGLFDATKKAAKETENAKNTEQQLASGRVKIDGVWYDSIEDYAIGKASDNPPEEEEPPVTPPEEPETPPEETDTTIKSYDNTEKDTNGVLTANATYASDGKTAVVPKGFKIVDGIEGTKSIADGLVIQDKDGNEFVWIPVEVTEGDTETEIASFYRSNWANNARSTSLKNSKTYTEPYASGYEGEEAEYTAMVKSVYKNGGFYIGRYEAGSETERKADTANGTTTMVVQAGKYPYNYVGWGASMSDYTSDVEYNDLNQGKGAVRLSKEMYQNNDVGVTSTLCYGVQWDAMLDFIKDNNHNVTDSSSWGYYGNSFISKPKNTGSSNNYAAKNIYDVAGNASEITMESYSSTVRVTRGGTIVNGNYLHRASNRHIPAAINTTAMNGFRVALYIK